MAFSIDASSAFLLPSQLRRLAEAVRDAGQHDESRWIEWKTTLPLGTDQARVHLVKHILGLANRAPEVAARWAGGFGYVVVGVSPGEVLGVTSVDHNDLEQDLKPFVGPDLVWNAEYIELDGKDVLIVVVDPPKHGDPIHYLHKALPHPKGNGFVHGEHTVFIRRNAQTVKAEAGDWQMLQQRFAATHNRLDVEIVAVHQQIETIPDYSEHVTAHLEERREQLLSARYGASHGDACLVHVSGDLATRTRDDYVADVDVHMRHLKECFTRRLLEELVRHRPSGLSLALVNRGDRPFRDVRFTVQCRQMESCSVQVLPMGTYRISRSLAHRIPLALPSRIMFLSSGDWCASASRSSALNPRLNQQSICRRRRSAAWRSGGAGMVWRSSSTLWTCAPEKF